VSTLTETIEVAATPEAVWALVSDLPGMGRLSPEATGGTWVKGATGPAVGARFKGSNRNGWRRWSTTSTVTEAVPGRDFGFRVRYAGLPVSVWHFDIEATPAGCRVTQTWTDERSALLRRSGGVATGVRDRETHNREGMRTTLQRVKTAAEVTMEA